MTHDPWTPRPGRIAVFRALQLGDMLCAVPALRALREFVPAARITLIGLPWASGFAHRFRHLVDDFLPFPGFPGNPEREAGVAEMLEALARAQERRFDLAIQLHGSGETSNRIVALLGAPRRAGFVPPAPRLPGPDGAAPRPPGFIPWPERQPEIHRYLSLMAFLGVPLRGTHLEMPIEPEEQAAWQAIAARHRLAPGRFVCLHPGSQLASRRWAPERFAAVGTALARDGYTVVVTGTAAEAPLAQAVMAGLPGHAVNLAGATTLGALAALLRDAALLVSNDTGVSHVAAAVGARSVVVANGSDVARWRPLDESLHRVLWAEAPCRPCAHAECPHAGHPCASAIAVEAVVAEARRLLQENLPHAA